jgi:excisionase family DNA binding protein
MSDITFQFPIDEIVERLRNMIREEISASVNVIHPTQHPDGYITRKEACDLLCITLPTLSTYTLEGKVKGYRIGRRVLYKKHEVEQATAAIKIK